MRSTVVIKNAFRIPKKPPQQQPPTPKDFPELKKDEKKNITPTTTAAMVWSNFTFNPHDTPAVVVEDTNDTTVDEIDPDYDPDEIPMDEDLYYEEHSSEYESPTDS
jgi:hypothetical protein